MIRKGDLVLVIAGNDKGKIGEILSRREERVVVQGINVRKKHLRRSQQTQGGRVIEMEMPIHISNVSLCDKEGKKKTPKNEVFKGMKAEVKMKEEEKVQKPERKTAKLRKRKTGTGTEKE